MPTLQHPAPGHGAVCWGSLGSGGEAWIVIPVPFLVPVELQRCTEQSHLWHTGTGKAQGMMLLRPPPPAHPAAAPALLPIPGRPFAARSSFPVVSWACLFAAFADSAQPCCPPDSSRSLGHGTARGMARPSCILHTHLCPAGLTCAPPGSPVPRQALPQPTAHHSVWQSSHQPLGTQQRWHGQAEGPTVPPTPHKCQEGWHEHHKKPHSHLLWLMGSSQNVPQHHREAWGV